MATEQQKQSEQQHAESRDESLVDQVESSVNEADLAEEISEASAQQGAEPAELLVLAQARIDELSHELSEQKLRTAAEVQNIRRRAEQDVEKAHKFALDKFAQELLPVVDSLERAIDACQAEDEATVSLRQGVEMTLSLFLNSVAKFNLEPVNPIEQPFDPELHQAISMVDVPNMAANTVVSVMQKGYTLNGRLVRPAMVVVAKG
ncbi:nucleotide exchange factor GrpE [Nitrincola tibetensis]|uniref:Protein GrpE n=1 Tax=Nitrincola tibetensis TaxID=2219697 RepID=A0A364NMS3_9GAMM|nr:nucleotide exchange factor GrpE [Nitrincola tibetensis]RAU18344.1 nucleotide exchange factor GrpE [Nitrincola tibetensis]